MPNERMPQVDFSELGRSGLRRFGGFIYEEFLPALSGRRAIKVFYEMSENDPTIGAMLFSAEQLIRKASWGVVPGGETSADQEAGEFLEDCMHDMSQTWTNTIVEILSMMVYGWSWHEIVYKKRDDGRIGWKKLPGRSQDSLYEWIFDENSGDLIGMKQQPWPDFEVRSIPLEKSLLFRTRANKDNPEGRSMLRSAYRPWYFKKRIEEIEGIGVERDLAGLPVLTPPPELDIWNDEDPEARKARIAAENLVKNIRRDENEGIVKPAGWDLVLLSTGSKRQFDTNDIINRYDQRIAVTVLADVVLMGAEKVGSYALSEVKKSLYAAGLEALLDSITEVFNQYAVPKLFKLNVFPGVTKLPKIKHGEVEAPDLDQISRLITAMHNTGSAISTDLPTENYIREIAGMPQVKTPGTEPSQRFTQFSTENALNRNNLENNPKQNANGKGGQEDDDDTE